MARIRTVKPEYWQHPKVTKVSRDARLLFLGLLNEADDAGRMRYSGKRLAGVLFAEDDDVDGAWIDAHVAELHAAGLVCRYTVDGAHLLEVCGFSEHQKINRPSESRLPSMAHHGTPHEDSVSPHGTVTDDSRTEGNREQGTGKGVAPAQRPRDLIFEAIIETWALEGRELTDTERARINKGVKQLRDIGADPGEIPARKAEFSRLFPDATATVLAVTGRWAECKPKAQKEPARPQLGRGVDAEHQWELDDLGNAISVGGF